jgi:hypothetical protein
MRTTVVHCDRCKARIDGPMSTLTVAGTLADTIERMDLCQTRGARLLEFIRAAYTTRGEALAPPADGSHRLARRRASEAPRPPAG